METPVDIAVFVRVVEYGSFTAAAEALELSKAAVSKYINRLEARLGTRLLNRTTRRLTLTEAGEALYQRTGGPIGEIMAAESEVMELGGRPRGRLRITAPAHFGDVFLVPRLCTFMRRYPDIELDLDLDNRIVDLVKERFDVGIRITTPASSSLVARRLADVRIVTVAAPEYLARHGTPQSPDDLREHECLAYSLARVPNEWHYSRPRGGTIGVRVRGKFRCNSDAALKRAALDGHGILRFPELFIEKELREGALVRLLDGFDPPLASLSAVFPARENLAPKVRVFVDYLAEQFRNR